MSILSKKYRNASGVVDAPDGYAFLASGNETVFLDKATDVAWGGAGSYIYRKGAIGSVIFNNANFGDPAPGILKAGFYYTGKSALAEAAAKNKLYWIIGGVVLLGFGIGTYFLLRN